MDRFYWIISNKILPNIFIILIFAFALLTSTFAAYRLSQSIPLPEVTAEENDELEATDNNLLWEDEVDLLNEDLASLTGTSPSNVCIITIAGKTYNLYSLAGSHSGPRGFAFFICNSDMTAVYQSQHGTNYTRIAPYLYTGPVITPPTQVINVIPTSIIPTPISNLCLITIAGQTYNLYPLAGTHSGPRGFGFFICNSDMTTIYQSQHGTNYTRIQPYLYNGSVGTNPNPTVIFTPTPKIGPCLITINGKVYDMNKEGFTSKHKGGDIFICNTDQTALFNSQHGTNYDMLHDYDINNSDD